MKKLIIGRGRECDIRLDDESDAVSRKQAVITFSPLGKMKIYDTSANGTYVNGTKVDKPNAMPVKRGDEINFAHAINLEWSKVKNPYRKTWNALLAFLILALIGGSAVMFLLPIYNIEQKTVQASPSTTTVETTPIVADEIHSNDLSPESTEDIPIPEKVTIKTPQKKSTIKKRKGNKHSADVSKILQKTSSKKEMSPGNHIEEKTSITETELNNEK